MRRSSAQTTSGGQVEGSTGTLTPTGGRGSELVFRRKKSIELSDMDASLTFSGAGPLQ